ncbi:toll/interleukin-1 receptor (TIR) domain-containing protein [Artemisia annua]|uniref:Toll/interleukin-1 receptor (TIR) domain-containing protein n=1 Tax=Artemisia annua TaxID=35608 RepID=A0A2U1NUM7_ARTAN|nr:toll/interleukin-1 receptor (TIR) domain-containing protein [Artemisia annua]
MSDSVWPSNKASSMQTDIYLYQGYGSTFTLFYKLLGFWKGLTAQMIDRTKTMADAYGAFYEFYSIHKMDKLRWLQLQTVKLTGSYKNFPELRWLCWHWYHLKMIPNVLLMSSLVAIDMSYGDLIKFELPMFAQDLKIIGDLKNISKLNLIGCKKLCKASSSKKYVKPERLKAFRIGGGDSTNRNQWEFMLCLLMNVVNYFKERCKKLCKASSSKKYVKPERLKVFRIGGGTPKDSSQ